jgi:hypothetical protein
VGVSKDGNRLVCGHPSRRVLRTLLRMRTVMRMRRIAPRTRAHSATTLFLNTPIPLISISHTSPGFMFSGMPSVPIHITSPGSMVQCLLTSEM